MLRGVWESGEARGARCEARHLRVAAEIEVGDGVARGACNVRKARGPTRLSELGFGRKVAHVQLRE